MRLLLYKGEQLIDSADVPFASQPKFQGQLIKETIQRLLQRNKQSFAASDEPPRFYLEGVPSKVNTFQSLKDKYAI